MNISEELKTKAVSLGLCTEWTAEWGKPNKEELVQKYIEGIDFCIKHNYPSNEYIKENFGDVAEKYGVFTDKKVDINNPTILVLNGVCTGKISIDKFGASTIYVRHNANIKIEVEGKAFIHLHDSARVEIVSNGKCFVYRHGGTVSAKGNVVVRDR